MEEEFDPSRAIRSKVEEALRFFVKLPILKPKPVEGGAFLEIPGPGKVSIRFIESNARVELRFAYSEEIFNFSGEWGDEDDEDEDVDPETAAMEAEESFKDELEALVNTTLDIIEESVFSARYKDESITLGSLFPAVEFEEMESYPDFKSISWNGLYNR